MQEATNTESIPEGLPEIRRAEVCLRDWYNRPWNVVLRPKSAYVAADMVRAMRAACVNDNVGYDQYQRTTRCTHRPSAVGWDITKIAIPCETDCSALIAVCANAAGIQVSKDIYTGNMVRALKATGQFEVLMASKYLTSDQYLQAGDVLVYEGHHTAMALQYGAQAYYRNGWNYDYNGWFYSPNGGRSYLRTAGRRSMAIGTISTAMATQSSTGVISGRDYYFEPRAGHPLECALYKTDDDGAQGPGEF